MIKAPFTAEQVGHLNNFQTCGVWHPFTCGGNACRETLVATEAGWTCPKCDYTQDWAHEFMAQPIDPDYLAFSNATRPK